MRKYIIMLSLVVILLAFFIPVSAEERVDDYLSEFESILPEGLSGISKDSGIILEKFSIKGLLLEIASSIKGEGGGISVFFLTLLGAVALNSLASLCHERFRQQTLAAVGIILSLLIFPIISSALTAVSASISEISRFFSALTPIAVGMTALGGNVTAAGVQAGGMYTALSIIEGISGSLFLSIASFGLAIATLSALGNSSASSVGKGIKSLFSWFVGIFTTVITGVFSLQTLVASAADSAAMRAARYMASGLIPMVGSSISGALATLASGLSYAKSIVGAGAIVALILMVITPLSMLLMYRLALSLAILIAELTGTEVSARIFSAYRVSLDMTVAVYALSVIVYLFQVILFLKVGVALE